MFGLSTVLAVIALLGWVGSFFVPRTVTIGDSRRGEMSREVAVPFRRYARFGVAAVVGLVVLTLVAASITVVPVGHAGVKTAFGQVTGQTSNGLQVHAPWETITNIDVRIQEFTAESADGADSGPISCPTRDDSTVTADVTVRWFLLEAAADEMVNDSGTDYEQKFVLPAIRSTFRDTCVGFDALDARSDRLAVAQTFEANLARKLDEVELGGTQISAFGVEGVDVRNVRLETSVAERANAKLGAQQAAEAAEFRLTEALVQAEITRAQSAAIYDGQQIIRCGFTALTDDDGRVTTVANTEADCADNLTPEVLTWRLIDTLPEIGSGAGDTIFIPIPDLLSKIGQGESFTFTNEVGGN